MQSQSRRVLVGPVHRVVVWKGEASARGKQHTQGNRSLSSTSSLGTRGPTGTVWNGGAGANAGINSSRLVILGGGEAGSREQGAWARAGLVHPRGPGTWDLVLGTGTGFWTCGDYPDNGKVPMVPTTPALYVRNWSQSRYRQETPDTDRYLTAGGAR